jgi:hypothetical protein
MGRLLTFAAKVRAFFAQSKANREFDEELEAHLQLLRERFVTQGMSQEDADTAARRQFGNTTFVHQQQREARTFLSPSTLWRDLCFGARMMRKNPGSTAAIVIALALGIGMNTCVFTFVNTLLLMQQGLFVTGIGLAIGLGVSFAATRLLSALLYGVRPNDPLTILAVSIGLTVVTLLACYIPARRAMRVDPMVALRYE